MSDRQLLAVRAREALADVLGDEDAARDLVGTMPTEQLAHVIAATTITDPCSRAGRLIQLAMGERTRRAEAAHEEAIVQAIEEAQRCYARLFVHHRLPSRAVVTKSPKRALGGGCFAWQWDCT